MRRATRSLRRWSVAFERQGELLVDGSGVDRIRVAGNIAALAQHAALHHVTVADGALHAASERTRHR
jgi:hypothetical protein